MKLLVKKFSISEKSFVSSIPNGILRRKIFRIPEPLSLSSVIYANINTVPKLRVTKNAFVNVTKRDPITTLISKNLVLRMEYPTSNVHIVFPTVLYL